jgi:DNA-binding response OmpR family regulator
MAVAVICSSASLEGELGHTFLWRRDFVRRYATSLSEAQQLAQAERPTVVVVDRDVSWAERIVTLLRRDAATRGLAVIVLARGAVRPAEADLIDAGADAVLRLPAGPGWDEDFARLIGFPLRRHRRVALQLRVDAQVADELITAQLLNLSVHGMLVQSPVPLESGREIQFSFQLPGAAGPITGSGRIVREATPTQFGVEFLVLDAEDRSRIARLCADAGDD